jgi:hypothetical protein
MRETARELSVNRNELYVGMTMRSSRENKLYKQELYADDFAREMITEEPNRGLSTATSHLEKPLLLRPHHTVQAVLGRHRKKSETTSARLNVNGTDSSSL